MKDTAVLQGITRWVILIVAASSVGYCVSQWKPAPTAEIKVPEGMVLQELGQPLIAANSMWGWCEEGVYGVTLVRVASFNEDEYLTHLHSKIFHEGECPRNTAMFMAELSTMEIPRATN